MAWEKGTGNLQREKSGRWTVRVGINGKCLSRSARTTDRDKAERFLNRFLAPLGLGAERLPLAEAWHHYEMSPNRRELTLDEVERLYAAASKEGREWRLLMATGLYTGLRLGDCCRLAWEDVNLDRQVIQVFPEKTKKHLKGRPVTIPIHPQLLAELVGTGERGIGNGEKGTGGTGGTAGTVAAGICDAPVSSSDTSSHSPLPIPHSPTGFVNLVIAELYTTRKWQLDEGLRRIFKAANITMSVRLKGRCRKSVIASFHSLRHTFVSLSANAGVPLPVVQSIVGHTSTAMTRHYYHENLDALRAAVAAIPAVGNRRDEGWGMRDEKREGNGERVMGNGNDSLVGASVPLARTITDAREGRAPTRPPSLASRLKRLSQLLAKGLITAEEHAATRARILAEI